MNVRGWGLTHPTIRSLLLPVYLPTFLFSAGEGAVVPFIALGARDLGASVALAGLLFAVRGVSSMVFGLPAGALVARLGERRAISLATAIVVIGGVGCAVSSSVYAYGASVVMLGAGWAVWLLARQSYVTGAVPLQLRGRALSSLGGVQRSGHFVGPLLAAAAISGGAISVTFLIHAALSVAGLAVLLRTKEPHGSLEPQRGRVPYSHLVRNHSDALRTAGTSAVILGALRGARPVALPLWAAHIGVDPAGVGLIFGLSSAMDMALFLPAGAVMDRWGRRYTALPCAVLTSLSFLLLPLTHSFVTLLSVGLLAGLANGIGSGIVMTLGSDTAPSVGRAEFLAMWQMLANVGMTTGPVLMSTVAGVSTIGGASVFLGVAGLAGALFMGLRLEETLTEPAVSPPD